MSPDLPDMRDHLPASRLTAYRLFRIFADDDRLNLTGLLLALLIVWTLASSTTSPW